jgi:hypothetical protein
MLLAAAPVFVAVAQLGTQEVSFAERNMGGPRLGMTYVVGKELTKRLDEKKIGHFISQFGWHFEYQVIPDGGGPAFVIQFVPLVGAVEYATLVPSATLAMGIRFPGGLEFGIGPNLLATQEYISSSLVLAIGKSINYGGVSIPLNVAAAVNPAGTRFSFIFGYAIAKAPAR